MPAMINMSQHQKPKMKGIMTHRPTILMMKMEMPKETYVLVQKTRRNLEMNRPSSLKSQIQVHNAVSEDPNNISLCLDNLT